VAHAVDALAYLPPRAVLVVVGKGDARPYRARARALGVERRVHFAGVRGDMAPLYRAADCFVLPSHYEAFSLVTLEAMASGLPVLLSRVNGAEDCLRDGRNGFFVAPNGKDIAAKAEVVCEDAALRRRLGRAARRTALRFTWDAAAAGFDAVVSGKGAGAAC
jgi:UDP-glucose:(heptosyl)LPS alpha-1,3-glucosyltransferase